MEYTRQNIRAWSRMGSNGAFGAAIEEIASYDDSLAVLTADLCSYSGLSGFKNEHPDMLYNVGIAEQNMVGIACGMAREGFNTFATTYASFMVTRCLDQVKVGIGYMGLPVRLVGLASGFSVGVLGATHMCCDDISIMRSIPGVTIISPADSTETIKATIASSKHDGPVYIRLTGGQTNPPVCKEDYAFEIGKSIELSRGSDVCIVSAGSMVYESVKAAQLLDEEGISTGVINMHTINPLDVSAIEEVVCREPRLVVVVEEHFAIGGLYSAVAEYMVSHGISIDLLSIGVNQSFFAAASYSKLLEANGLSARGIADSVSRRLLSSETNRIK